MGPTQDSGELPIIDAHVHLFPDRVFASGRRTERPPPFWWHTAAVVQGALRAMVVCSAVAAVVSLGCSSTVAGPSDPGGPESRAPKARSAAASASLSEDEVQALVDAHNAARAAVGVPPLSWDSKVADTAEAWAAELSSRGCDLQHSAGGPYGENLYWSSAPSRAQAVVGSWMDEAEHFNARKNKCARGEVCGHYTQVVWADSRTVGCAKASCGSAQVWVCNYDPPGNFVGQKPF